MKPMTLAERSGLFRAARQDGPGASQKSRIWEGVALAPQLSLVATAGRTSVNPGAVAAGATKTFAATAIGALSAGKLLLAGAVVGSALTVGLGAFLLRGPIHPPVTLEANLAVNTLPVDARPVDAQPVDEGDRGTTPHAYAPEAPTAAPLPVDVLFAFSPPPPPSLQANSEAASVPGMRSGVRAATSRATVANVGVPSGDALSREVALVGDARKALALGRGGAALAVLDAAAHGSSRSLEPEELSLRVRALRMLGRDVEADRVNGTLKALYPGSFLAR